MSHHTGLPPAASTLKELAKYPAVSMAVGVGILALSSLYCVFPLLTHEAIPMGHDTLFHIFQADQFQKGMEVGSVYPRWAADANNGYGTPPDDTPATSPKTTVKAAAMAKG